MILAFAIASMVALTTFAQEEKKVDFENETRGAEAKSFSSVIGTWHIDKDSSNLVYAVDGRKWQNRMSSGVADKAKALYGQRYGEFLDNIAAYKYYPLSICNGFDTFKSGVLSVSFKGISGRIDQSAGVAFNIKQNGDYLVVRANCLENNLVLWKLEKGVRTAVQWIRNIPTPSYVWHTLKVIISGNKIEGYLDGKKYIEYSWIENIDGKIGLWSKSDSYVFFDNFLVQPTNNPPQKTKTK
jgi:hypothetical protein